MEITTTRFGNLEVDPSDIITFERGILGFEHLRDYILLNFDGKSPFSYLQSAEDPDLAFVVLDPTAVWPDYRVKLAQEEVADLGIESDAEAAVLAIVTVPSEVRLMTANLQGPLVINPQDQEGKTSSVNR